MNIHDLQYFLKICETGSLSKASQSLFISQQGLSKSISKMEDELNICAFNRSHSGMIPNKYGTIILNHAKNILDEYQELLSDLEQVRTENKQKISLTMELGTLALITPRPFLQYMNENPDVSLEISEHTERTCERLMQDNECELGFTNALEGNTSYHYYLLFSLKPVILISNKHSLALKESVSLRDITRENILMCGSAAYYSYLRLFRKYNITPKIIWSSIERKLPTEYIEQNAGVCPSFDGFFDVDFSHTNIEVRPFCNDYKWFVSMYLKKENKPSKSLQKFMRYMCRCYDAPFEPITFHQKTSERVRSER